VSAIKSSGRVLSLLTCPYAKHAQQIKHRVRTLLSIVPGFFTSHMTISFVDPVVAPSATISHSEITYLRGTHAIALEKKKKKKER
jgi:hypothetical protein